MAPFILFTLAVFPFFPAFGGAQTTFQPYGRPFASPVTVAPGLYARILFSNLTLPRGVAFDSHGNLLVIERGLGVSAFTPATNGSGTLRKVVLNNTGVTHGIQVDGDKLYISTATEAVLYKYDAAAKTVVGEGKTLVTGFNAGGELTTHTLQLTPARDTLLVSSGPDENIDPTARDPASGNSQIRSFALSSLAHAPVNFTSGVLVAYGIRNPAGIAFFPGSSSQLYVVENGASIDNVTRVTPAFVNDNPADELELVDLSASAKFYGFPDCTTLWNGSADPTGDPQFLGLPRGAQFSLELKSSRGDHWCRDLANNRHPHIIFQAHSVPLDIKFYSNPSKIDGALPAEWTGQAFVTFHGSFDRSPPTGYAVVRLPHPALHNSTYTPLVQATNLTSCPGACIRPAGIAFGPEGKLYVSSDSSGEVFVLERA
ncbi:soluble quino protein glucose dehydrogenase [Dentipellis sp. KUC8613]|nr:soluble quino protein glucose dehydrogenase [Dentipellis sp. KUC8613]